MKLNAKQLRRLQLSASSHQVKALPQKNEIYIIPEDGESSIACLPNCQPSCLLIILKGPCEPELIRRCVPQLITPPPKPPN